jgi:hypothetical protein
MRPMHEIHARLKFVESGHAMNWSVMSSLEGSLMPDVRSTNCSFTHARISHPFSLIALLQRRLRRPTDFFGRARLNHCASASGAYFETVLVQRLTSVLGVRTKVDRITCEQLISVTFALSESVPDFTTKTTSCQGNAYLIFEDS